MKLFKVLKKLVIPIILSGIVTNSEAGTTGKIVGKIIKGKGVRLENLNLDF